MRERLAALAHEQWSGWMRHVFSRGVLTPEGTLIIPKWAVDRWLRQMNTAYAELPEAERESDRAEADRALSVVEASL